MHRLNQLAAELTPAQVKQLEDFAEFLIAREKQNAAPARSGAHSSGIEADQLMGLCKDMGGDKSDNELIRAAWDDIAAKYR